jgi:hypothetical protein
MGSYLGTSNDGQIIMATVPTFQAAQDIRSSGNNDIVQAMSSAANAQTMSIYQSNGYRVPMDSLNQTPNYFTLDTAAHDYNATNFNQGFVVYLITGLSVAANAPVMKLTIGYRIRLYNPKLPTVATTGQGTFRNTGMADSVSPFPGGAVWGMDYDPTLAECYPAQTADAELTIVKKCHEPVHVVFTGMGTACAIDSGELAADTRITHALATATHCAYSFFLGPGQRTYTWSAIGTFTASYMTIVPVASHIARLYPKDPSTGWVVWEQPTSLLPDPDDFTSW